MEKLEEWLIENPVIAAIRNDEDLKNVITSKVLIVFVLYGSIMTIKKICEKLKKAEKVVFVHVDLIEGLKGDHTGMLFIKECGQPYGIISTRATNIKNGKKLGFCAIQRIFAVDSLSLETGIRNIQSVLPDAVEVMPGVASKIIKKMGNEVKVPIIAGGLIETKKDIMESISAGAMAISTTKQELWNLS
ncbi:glycerol-3-phosphate responsive antiterminator [Clostridium gasigenes]|uniref:Glycerol-3-phosphate responsive antiterminator n=1 Tax=Clostridium gasigenes TaxID=94869 RepID=A0A7X0SB94_9CLOT|nr:glycerol-3-phosphate responsive antiterminator [Clostridium gasigenes]MBB6622874.1 glycerol-3-phosphate responsive antiterminator [Clostridium gasigenes]MBB6714485.1 glycerol-3-phosphate responsive antiterminator [Clostridium gasigenes]MBU3089358.1 glycerol-3-phosphate responsive antiterminator [Clostridium gasigenes]MBU3103593.1 glycerol-3-phosphate responsive antiterminator [Clostridium gasigenes]MBU3133066.1 glycerol-3-phosphate responsive antiterminator [Clostridium gasigenes]